MAYDDVIVKLGNFGRYQKLIFYLLCLTAIPCAFHKMAGVFLLAKPDFRCLLPFENSTNAEYNLTEDLWAQYYPKDTVGDKFRSCVYLNVNRSLDSSASDVIPTRLYSDCDNYVYDRSKYESSAVIEWNLVCGRGFLSATSDAMFMLGVLLGSIIFGQLSDKYGRKPIFFASLVIQVVFGILAGISPDYYTYTICRLIVGSTTSGVFLVAYVIAMEMVGPTKRLFAGMFLMMFFSLGFMLTAGFAYYIHEWRTLQIAISVPGVIFLTYHWIIPESARWLLSKNCKESAKANIQKAARFNKVDLSDDVLEDLLNDDITAAIEKDVEKEKKTNNASVFDLLKYPNLRKKTLLIFWFWFVNSGTYYALSWNTSRLGENDLLNFVISGAVEIPAYTFLLFTLNTWGRRTILCCCMLVGGTGLLLTIFVPENMNWLNIFLAMLGKLAITASYGTIYIFSAEQFPTVVRNVGLGAASMVARIGGISAPYLNLLGEIWVPLPLIICGIFAVTGGLLSLLLPETLNKSMPETIEDGENFGKKFKSLEIGDLENGEELQELNNQKSEIGNKNQIEEQQPLNSNIKSTVE